MSKKLTEEHHQVALDLLRNGATIFDSIVQSAIEHNPEVESLARQMDAGAINGQMRLTFKKGGAFEIGLYALTGDEPYEVGTITPYYIPDDGVAH